MPRYKAVLHADVVVVLGQDKLVNARVQDLRQAGTWTGSPILSRFCGAGPSPHLRGLHRDLRKHGKTTWCHLTMKH
jgi:hypothetical protein